MSHINKHENRSRRVLILNRSLTLRAHMILLSSEARVYVTWMLTIDSRARLSNIPRLDSVLFIITYLTVCVITCYVIDCKGTKLPI